ncbi:MULTISPECIES: helix-turn-helix domain-containing protein [Cysteiniphilum]|uniref:helix-turn-helix domain-containing protein n=1 Tax=Cysteiniphilum TaxID=2056696 RepID=UPI0017817EE1|nr:MULTISPECIES: helix-turn-helix transcriptional regulator [Cysteiniphilum]
MFFLGEYFLKRKVLENASKEDDLGTLGGRLKYALQLKALRQVDIAQNLNIPAQTIQAICSGKIKKSKYTLEIAAVLDINPVWLSTGKGSMLLKDGISNESCIELPILTMTQIEAYLNNGECVVDRYLSLPFNINNHIKQPFVIQITDKEERFGFVQGSILIFSELQTYDQSAYYLFNLHDTLTLGKLALRDGEFCYQLNINKHVIRASEIKGQLIEARLNYGESV